MNNQDEFALAARFNYKEWSRVAKFLKPYKVQVAILLTATVITAFFDSVFPLMTQYAIRQFITPQTTQGIGVFALVFISLAMIQTLGSVVYCRQAISIEMGVSKDMRYSLFSHVQGLSLEYFNSTPVGFILARIMSDTGSLGSVFSWRMSDFFFNSAYVIFAGVNMARLNFKLMLMVFATIPLIFVIGGYFQKKLLVANRVVRRQNSVVTASYNENVNGATTIKELDTAQKTNEEFGAINAEMRIKSMSMKRIENVFFACFTIVGTLALAVVLGEGPQLVNMGLMDIATLAVFINYTFTIVDPVESVLRTMTAAISLQANVERVNLLMDAQPTVKDEDDVIKKYGDIYNPIKENWEKIEGDIEFKDVSFKYPDSETYVLEHFNLKIKAGTSVAIVGATGAGKSTLVNLVCRFFEPTSGEILIDGTDYRTRSLLWLQSNLSYVLQTPHLFSGTILENIRYADQNATMEQVISASKQAQAHYFIEKLPQGYDTQVGQGGDKLSTGQKQLVSIARALLANGKILVMDEATSSVDTKTEQLINSITGDLLKNRTSFIIAHRLSTVKNADIIIVVDEGKIIEMGTHSQLLRKGGHYYDL
ncbi:MAG: ABC transporter ATP-binding protein, partial [Oscillospiraceae bacterium]